MTAIHVDGCVAFLAAWFRVIKKQPVGTQLFLDLAVLGAMVVQIALDRVRVESRFLGTLEFVVLLLAERQACNRSTGCVKGTAKKQCGILRKRGFFFKFFRNRGLSEYLTGQNSNFLTRDRFRGSKTSSSKYKITRNNIRQTTVVFRL